MRKILILITSLILFGVTTTASAKWYGPHLRPYPSPGPMTLCNDDGQGVAKACVQISGFPIIGTTGICNTSIPSGFSGDMTCLFWDEEIPTISDNYGLLDGKWTNGLPKTITLSPNDTGGSGISTTKRCVGTSCAPFIVGTSITISTDFNDTIRYQTWDNAGNTSSIGSIVVKIDSVNPSVNDNYSYDGQWVNGTRTINLSPTDNVGGSGIDYTKWCEGSFCNPSLGNTGTTIIKGGDYNNKIRYQTWDEAGNSSGIGEINLKIDNTDPLVSDTYGYDGVWVSGTNTITLNPSDTIGWSGIDYTKRCEGISCNPAFGNTGTIIIKGGNYNNIIRYQTWDNAGNSSTTIGSVNVKIDNTTPTLADLTNLIGNLITANDNLNYEVEVDNQGYAPIDIIEARKEDFNSGALFIGPFNMSCNTIGSTSTCSENWNTSKVDNDRNPGIGGRYYTFRITKICDEAGNCWTGIKDTHHQVYANLSISGSIQENDLIDSSNVADGSIKNLTIKLVDSYLNEIIPSPGITRKIDFRFNTDNSVYLNQNTKTGTGVFVKIPDSLVYSDLIPIGNNRFTDVLNQDSSDGDYNFKFKIYTPTRQSYLKSNSSLYFRWITSTISDSLGSVPNYYITDSTFYLRSLPIYYTTISGGIVQAGFREGTVQNSSINIIKNPTFTSPALKKMYIEFGSGDINQVNSVFNLKVGTTSGAVNVPVGEGSGKYILFKDDYLVNTNYPIYTKFQLQTGGTINPSDLLNSYFSTHIGYDIGGPNGGSITPLYNSDIYGKDSYWGSMATGASYANAVKVIGQTYSKTYNETITGQLGNEIKVLNGSITKSSLKKDVRKKAFNLIKNTPKSNSGNTINNSNFNNNIDGTKLSKGNIIYFGGLDGQNVNLEPLTFSGNKTILIEGGNIYIKGDINVTGLKSILSIVVLKDSNGKGGNIYIDPDVSFIKAILYADKSLISAQDINGNGYMETSEEYDGNTDFSILENQLYIYGSVFSENTTGGSRSNPIKCPYYVKKTDCTDQETAQKYDLNYLRLYYLIDTDYNGTVDTPAGSGDNYFSSGSVNYKYPLVIQYNPLIQTNPPLIFKK